MLSIRGKVRGVATGNSNCGDYLPSPSNLIQFLFDSELDEIGVRLDDNLETIVFARYSDSSDHRQAHTHAGRTKARRPDHSGAVAGRSASGNVTDFTSALNFDKLRLEGEAGSLFNLPTMRFLVETCVFTPKLQTYYW